MRIGIIGTFVWDTIWHPTAAGAEPIEQWGGLAYSMCGFAGSVPLGVTLVPIARVGADLAPDVHGFLDTLPAEIVRQGIRIVPEPNNRVELRYGSHAERSERLSGGVSPWPWKELRSLVESVDVLYVNFLSGMEMSLECSEEIYGCGLPVYADLHSLFLSPPAGVARVPRRLPDWERWLRSFDAVQMNENELGLLGPERPDALELLPDVPDLGPVAVFVTQGAVGATYVTRLTDAAPTTWPGDRRRGGPKDGVAGRIRPLPKTIPVPYPGLAGDPTGCGDVWGSVLFSGLCAGLDVERAVRRAHRAAAAKLCTPRIEGLVGSIREELGRD